MATIRIISKYDIKDHNYFMFLQEGARNLNTRVVIWGAGEKGKRMCMHISEYVDAFIDVSSEKQGQFMFGKPIISYEEYKKNYSTDYILISYSHEQEIVDILVQDGINRYFLMTEFPGEFQTSNPTTILKDSILKHIDRDTRYAIYGVDLYGFILNEWIKCKLGYYVPMIFHKNISEISKKNIKKDYPEYDYQNLNHMNMDELLVTKEQDLDMLLDIELRITNVYDFSSYIEEYHNIKIEKYRLIHKAQRCFIVATGPSLKMEDLETLHREKEICISMNGIWRAFDKTEWRPNYYIADDFRAIDEFANVELDNTEMICFLGDTSQKYWAIEHGDNILKHHFNYEYSENRPPKFSSDFSRQCYMGSTVTYSCIQLATYMGFNEIYLLGVDFSYGDSINDMKYSHFFEEKKLTSTGYTKQVLAAYKKANEYAEKHNLKIYNATRGGKLEVFERVNFDDLF